MKAGKKIARTANNRFNKQAKAYARSLALIELGKTVVETEVPTGNVVDGKPETKKVLSFPPTGPKNSRGRVKQPKEFQPSPFSSTSLLWVGAKQHAHTGARRKSRPGNKELHAAAIPDNQAFALATLAKQEAAERKIMGSALDKAEEEMLRLKEVETIENHGE